MGIRINKVNEIMTHGSATYLLNKLSMLLSLTFSIKVSNSDASIHLGKAV